MLGRSLLTITLVAVLVALATPRAEARNFQLKGDNELSGGIGFAGDMADMTPGGFKWFNEYSRRMTKLTWLNFQLNFVLGGGGHRDCYWDTRGHWHCDDRYHFGGYAIDMAVGVKFKWRLKKVPLQFHAKVGGAVDFIIFDWAGIDNITGVAFAVRGGFGVRYFFVPTFGVGAELVPTFGPAFFSDGFGAEPFAAIDFNTGVEWRF